MASPSDRVYTETHEWVKVEGDTATIGLTRFAVDNLTDVTYVGLKPVGTKVRPGESIGEVESVKTASDIYSAVEGEIIAVNPVLATDPGVVNADPYERGWLARVRISDRSGLERCLSAEAYDARYGG